MGGRWGRIGEGEMVGRDGWMADGGGWGTDEPQTLGEGSDECSVD